MSMIPFHSIPARLKAAEADYLAARKTHDAARARFDAELAELDRLQGKRSALAGTIKNAKDEADTHRQTWKDRIKSATADFLADKSAGLSSDIGESRLSTKMAEQRADEHAAILAEVDAMIEAHHGKIAKAATALWPAYRAAAGAYARQEALKASLTVIPVLLRAQAAVYASDAAGDDVAFIRYMELPRDAATIDHAEATDGLGYWREVKNTVEHWGGSA